MSSPVIDEILLRARDLFTSVETATKPATATSLGGVKLAGDLAGAADAPTIPALEQKANLGPDGKLVQSELPAQQVGDVAGAAPLESPALTGSPTVNDVAVVVANDPRLTDARDTTTARITDATDIGRTVLGAVDEDTARDAIGAAKTVHTHTITEVDGLQVALDEKAPMQIEYVHPVWGGTAVTGIEVMAWNGALMWERQSSSVRGGDGPPPEWLPVQGGDVWIDFTTGKHYEYEEDLS